ncbi:MAG: hypothetical protein K2G60_03515 [Oscillospiraceae bacterium]|nr:hypothetical protein [Oscillospiraceae bacterium]
MKKYFLNTGTGKLHITDLAIKTCEGQMLKEHRKEFDTIEEAEKYCDRNLKKCKFCFNRERLNNHL